VRLRGAPLLGALDQHLPGAREHAEATASYAFAAAVGLRLRRAGAEICRETAKLHDVGKVYVPQAILHKPPAELTADEAEQLAGHYEAGARLALGAGIPDDVCGWLLQARERFDGRGPDGLAGSSIPIAARVTRAACACAGLLAASAGAGEDKRSATSESLRAMAGTELDPDAVEALAAILEQA
jgi:HD-GYP domain-containing protein (c-di-GMP phosphodiesterase class II)